MGTGKKVTFAAGYITVEAEKYLREHGACIDTALGLSMIELPESAEICRPSSQSPQGNHVIQWLDEDGNDPLEWIEVNLEFDVSETRVTLKRARTWVWPCNLCGNLGDSNVNWEAIQANCSHCHRYVCSGHSGVDAEGDVWCDVCAKKYDAVLVP